MEDAKWTGTREASYEAVASLREVPHMAWYAACAAAVIINRSICCLETVPVTHAVPLALYTTLVY